MDPSEFFPFGEEHAGIEEELEDPNVRRFLLDDIDSVDAYKRGAADGYRAAKKYLYSLKGDVMELVPERIELLHYLLYARLFKDAGRFRQDVEVTFGGRLGAPRSTLSNRIRSLHRDLELLIVDSGFESPDEDGLRKRVLTLAFYHAKFILIHPFRDGNGRISRLIAHWQEACLMKLPPKPVTWNIYYQALPPLPTDLSMLANYFCHRLGENLVFNPRVPPPRQLEAFKQGYRGKWKTVLGRPSGFRRVLLDLFRRKSMDWVVDDPKDSK